MTSSAWAPACKAAARMKYLMLEPVWRGEIAMFVSRWLGRNCLPPTIARMAPDLVSSETIAASMPVALSGRMLRAFSACDCRNGSNVVWMRRPPRYSRWLRSWYVAPRMSERFSR
jgi:hypothetical protein